MVSLTRSHHASSHFQRVQAAMRGYGQSARDAPCYPIPDVWESRLRMLMEELLVPAESVGVTIFLQSAGEVKMPALDFVPLPNFMLTRNGLPAVLDAIADISVVNTGNFVACGVPDTFILEIVDHNNLQKIATGKLNPDTGKFEKSPMHPAPDIAGALALLTE